MFIPFFRRAFALVSVIFVLAVSQAPATRHTVTFSGFTFSPSTITIAEGDTVDFVLSSIHNALEVSQVTWNIDGITPRPGGFSVPFGGGEAVPSGIGTHYYVCSNHVASFGMKGTIVVEAAVPPVGLVSISSVVDRDGILATTGDRVGKNWSLTLFKDSIASGIVAGSVASAQSLLLDSLAPGTYVAVEADSVSWTHISQTVDGIPQGPTALNSRTVVVGGGDAHTIEFLNYAPNVVISSGLVFQPETLRVDSGATVRFVLEPIHNAREVDSIAWSANDTTPNGGFETGFGGGDVSMTDVGTRYYVCVPHGPLGMKGVIIVRSPGFLSLPVSEGWNLLSMPVLPDDGGVATIYPTASSQAFTYQNGYQSQAAVSPGRGYWLKFGADQSVDLHGEVVAAETVAVVRGWNIIGSLSFPVPVGTITSEPGGLITSAFFGYASGYSVSDTLQPGFGYWVKVGGDGSLILQASPSASLQGAGIRIVPVPEVPSR